MSTSKVKSEKIGLPQFSSSNPEFWLETVDAILSFGNYDNDQKYEHVKKHLCNGVNDYIIKNFQDEKRRDGYMGDMYMGFRTYIINEKKEAQFNNLASVETFKSRDLKPSAFLKIISGLMYAIPKSIIRTIWLARLPRRIQKVLMAAILKDPAPMEERSLDSLAELADGIAAYEKYHTWYTLSDDHIITLPSYIENDPELWFYTLDEAFARKKVTDDVVKFESSRNALYFNISFTASLFLTELPNRPKTNQYDNLRERMIKTFAVIKGDAIYRLVFRNKEGLKPSIFFNLLSDLAAKSGKSISHLVVRTLWIMQLPIRTQVILFDVIAASREPLQDLDMDALCLLADGAAHSTRALHTLQGCLPGPALDETEVDTDILEKDLQMAKTLQEKIAIGMRYCDYMYRVYYDHSPSESITSCTKFHKLLVERLSADEYFLRGCTCWYHKTYGADAINCAQVEDTDESDYSE